MDFKQLPVYRERDRILAALKDHQVVVVESPTGSGKTTQLPLILWEAGFAQTGMIGVTQPRRIAAVGVSSFIAKQLGTTVPGLVGYKMRFEDKTVPQTKVKIMTDGTLLQEIKADPWLKQYDVLMVDEAHERSLNIDFILGLLKNVLPHRPEFRIIISSATINAEVFSTYFDGCPIVHIETPTYPVEVVYDPVFQAEESPDALTDKIVEVVSKTWEEGDILIFLPGEKAIKDAQQALSYSPLADKLWIVPLYGRLSNEEQEKVFDRAPEGQIKVVLSTNIAETSITIDGVRVVIDSGLAKINYYNPRTFTSSLLEAKISKASANQRKGRAGRTAAGLCYRLYEKEEFETRDLFTLEEIYRTDLSEVVLRMAELGIRDFHKFDFLSPPQKAGLNGAIDTLKQLDALNEDLSLSKIGAMMVPYPLLPKHARMVVEAILRYPDVLEEVLIGTSFVSTDSPFLLPQGEEMEARRAHHSFADPFGDFVSYLKIYRAFTATPFKEKFCEKYYLEPKALLEIVNIKGQLEEIVSRTGVPILSGGSTADYLCAMAKGLIQFVCQHQGRGAYRSLTAERILIHPGSVLFKATPAYIVAAEIVRTSRTYARSVSPLEKTWLNRIAPDLAQSLARAEAQGEGAEGREGREGSGRDGGREGGREGDRRRRSDALEPWQVQIGREIFTTRGLKGKDKVAILPWDQLQRAVEQLKPSQFNDYRHLKGRVEIDGQLALEGIKVAKILEIASKLDLRRDQVNEWPQGKSFAGGRLGGLAVSLPDLLKPARPRAKSQELGFLSLQTDGRGQYWFKIMKSFSAALAESLASLECLADEGQGAFKDAEWKQVNAAYRRLNEWL